MIDYVFGLSVRVLLTDEDNKILILKRSTDSKTNPGKWEFPGGKVDQGESFDQALIREVYEETQLKISLEHVVGISEQNLHLIRAVHIIMSGKIIEGNLTLSSEHEGYAWVFFENLDKYELADWLDDFVNNQETVESSESNDINQVTNTVKPWLKSIQGSMDKILKR
ncbi:NUDIX domain-containing protein [Methanobacterium formicicum]|uniref:NUDIX hydrolase n=1 Tax=Methanobacterium formicicum (strain DSM 3637 / PP1) TaxID=1204725 RepID=K2QEJ4_METFP|nr:NUDIX domain-containing protein [Methanobacterium formicicum]EKF86511.1 NUDIX hydrolase [Methanobacterium formicicum DSM 3637]